MKILALVATSLVMSAVVATAGIELPKVIGSHMVLQRDMAVPIWGKAAPGETVTVTFAGQQKSATADADGKWMVKLDPMPASAQGRELTISAVSPGNQPAAIGKLILTDVLVGEVWVGSGQSNMKCSVTMFTKVDPVLIAAASKSYPTMRLLVTAGAGWREATPENLAPFSALLFGFGLVLNRDLAVPVGLMEASMGTTSAGHWISAEGLQADPVIQKLRAWPNPEYEKICDQYRAEHAAWEKEAAAAKLAGKPVPHEPGGPWNAVQLRLRGYGLLRRKFWREPLGKPGDWFGDAWVTRRFGGFGYQYDNRVRPVQPYGIRGVVWDQGESGTAIVGASGVEEMDQYTVMGALIRSWRKDWGQDFPFIYVQKPSGPGCAWDYDDPVTRCANPFAPLPEDVPDTQAGLSNEGYISIMQYTNTAMAISSDLGVGLHPPNKSGYGARAARVALGMVYGKDLEYYGPMYESHKLDGGKLRVSFSHVGKGLAWKHGDKLQGFAVAGENKVFHWADAVIEGSSVVVSSDKIRQPVAVRYAWGGSYPWANLFNKDGLPAIPFRTDAWQ